MNAGDSKLVRVKRPGPLPSLSIIADQLGVPLADLDAGFGVRAEDAENGLWNVLLLRGEPGNPGSGEIFSNPKIATFGPTRS